MARVDNTSVVRPYLFWIAAVAIVASAVVLLHEILLPFLAGMALAYVLDPLVHRLERIGVNRGVAAFAIISLFICAVLARRPRARAESHRLASQAQSRLDYLRRLRFRLSIRLRRSADRRAARGCNRRNRPVRSATICRQRA
jgi:hypothetical protein